MTPRQQRHLGIHRNKPIKDGEETPTEHRNYQQCLQSPDSITQQFHLSVEEYITFLELEYQASRLSAMEKEAEAEVLKHNLLCARAKLDKVLTLVEGSSGEDSFTAATSLCTLEGYELRLPDYAQHQRVLDGFLYQQKELEETCTSLKQKIKACQGEEDTFKHLVGSKSLDRQGRQQRRYRLESNLVDLFRTAAKVESQAFSQHEAVSRNYDKLLDRYMLTVDEMRQLKNQIKSRLGSIVEA